VSSDTIIVDGVTIDALASSTRRNILKKITLRPMTVSELARELTINKSAIFSHLLILQNADLISRRDNGNEFVYYELTDKGEHITRRDENSKFVIYLTASGLAFIAGVITIFLSIENYIAPKYWNSLSVDIPQLVVGSVLIFLALLILLFGLKRKKM
jgi:DNA-binding transcriptional ArsR family regulator